MDFYIRTFNIEALGEGAGSSLPVERCLDLKRQSEISEHGWVELMMFNYDPYPEPLPDSKYWSLSDSASLAYYTDYPVVVDYHAVDSSDYISEYHKGVLWYPIDITYFKAGSVTGYNRTVWTNAGWTAGTQATFEEELCDFFYSITQQQPSNKGTLGVNPETMCLYLYRLYLTDSDTYQDIPVFMRGNDPQKDRIYTASIIT